MIKTLRSMFQELNNTLIIMAYVIEGDKNDRIRVDCLYHNQRVSADRNWGGLHVPRRIA